MTEAQQELASKVACNFLRKHAILDSDADNWSDDKVINHCTDEWSLLMEGWKLCIESNASIV
jgi:hypothetical protein